MEYKTINTGDMHFKFLLHISEVPHSRNNNIIFQSHTQYITY